jgi:DNA-binding MarR family transcriptional regulator
MRSPSARSTSPAEQTAAGQDNEPAGTERPPATALDLSYLEGTIGYALRRAQLAVFRDIYRAFGEIAVTTAQFSVLAVVADNPGVNQADLALALNVERPRMVPLIDALERRGLAIRVASASDRRHRQIYLTDEGTRLLGELKRRFAAHQARIVERLEGAGAEALLQSLWRLAKEPSGPREAGHE